MVSISPELLAREFRLQDICWDTKSQWLIVLEGRSDRNVLVGYLPERDLQRDLTRDWKVRASVGYGGGDFCVAGGRVYYVEGNRLFCQDFDCSQPSLLTEAQGKLCCPKVSPDGRWILVVISGLKAESNDQLSILPVSGGPLTPIFEGSTFCMQPNWHPDSRCLAWVGWSHPAMPWDETQLYMAQLEYPDGQPVVTKLVDLSLESTNKTAFFQPEFSPDGSRLAYISDHSDWFNLRVISTKKGTSICHYEDEAEHACPAWIHGLRTFGWCPSGESLYVLRSSQGFSSIHRFKLDGGQNERLGEELEHYTSLRQIAVSPSDGQIAVIGSSAERPPQILCREKSGRVKILRTGLPESTDRDSFSRPEPIKWTTLSGLCHGLYFPPHQEADDGRRLPAVIKIHGGPTSQYNAEFDLDTQFFCSRGFAVLAINYRGSSGYGRAYREELYGGWGIRDVEDVKSCADHLVTQGLADPRRLILAGGSAGGFTVLASLIRFPGFYRAGICRYGVSDLLSLTQETHRFELHYLDSLIGPLPQATGEYRRRSPITQVAKIRDPLALFQGDLDTVVPQNQSDKIATSLEERNVPHVYEVFQGEGHGWKKASTIRQYYAVLDEFLGRYVDGDQRG